MKNAVKRCWRMFLHFWYPAIVLCWGTECYTTGHNKGQWIWMALGFLLTLCGLMTFYDESEKLQKEEKE